METHGSPPLKGSKPGLDRAGSLVQLKPGRLFGRPGYAHKGRKWRGRGGSVQREHRGDPTKQWGRACPGEEGGPPQDCQPLKAGQQQRAVCRSAKVFICGLRPSGNTGTLPYGESEFWERNPFSPVLTPVWELPEQWPGEEEGEEVKGLPKSEASSLLVRSLS